MKKYFLLLALLVVSKSTWAFDLEVSLTQMRNASGNVLIAVFNSADGFPKDPKKAYLRLKLPTSQAQKFVIQDLPQGTYALSIAHDENGNDTVDTGFLGIPKEGIGFSRNPDISFGPPSFAKAAYSIDQSAQIEIKVHYY